jgi:hypothetical protein
MEIKSVSIITGIKGKPRLTGMKERGAIGNMQ